MASIMQGTTPSLTITIDPDDLLLSAVTAMDIKIKNVRLKSYELNDMTINSEENSFSYHFTEEETTELNPKKPIVVQGRLWVGEEIFGIDKIYFDVADMMGVGTDG